MPRKKRQGGGIGTRGLGETNIELMKRHWRGEIKKVKVRLDKMAQDRARRLERRKEIGFKTVSIVGYTNAGKTTLFNRLSGKKKFAKDVLFATLDSSVGKLFLPKSHKQVLVSDTIGFIQNLPAKLIEAFRSTLMESVHSDLLLHIIDTSDPLKHEKIAVVENTLQELGIEEKHKIYVFNKIDAKNIDRQELLELYWQYNPHFISAETGEGIAMLLSTIEQEFSSPHIHDAFGNRTQ